MLTGGKVEIRIETTKTAASVTFWNNGNVSAIGTKKDSLQELIFDDRPISADEDLASLLDTYFGQIQGA
jgi:hypothetical protein